jgi:hypothetical protein
MNGESKEEIGDKGMCGRSDAWIPGNLTYFGWAHQCSSSMRGNRASARRASKEQLATVEVRQYPAGSNSFSSREIDMVYRVFGIGFLALIGMISGACASADPEDMSQDFEDVASAPSEEASSDVNIEGILQSEDEDTPLASCLLEVVEACIANYAVCAVRCCDDSLFKSYKYCGDCKNWAYNVCGNHDGPKRIRWEWP